VKYAERRALRSEIVKRYLRAIQDAGPIWNSNEIRDADWELAKADFLRYWKKWARKFKADTPKGGVK